MLAGLARNQRLTRGRLTDQAADGVSDCSTKDFQVRRYRVRSDYRTLSMQSNVRKEKSTSHSKTGASWLFIILEGTSEWSTYILLAQSLA